MAESSPKGQKTLWEKVKLLVTSNFTFSHSVFKRLVMQTRKNQGLFGKGLNSISIIVLQPVHLHLPAVLLTSTPNKFYPSHLLLSHISIIERMDRRERTMNLVTMTIIRGAEYLCRTCTIGLFGQRTSTISNVACLRTSEYRGHQK